MSIEEMFKEEQAKRGRTVSPGRPPTETELKLAEALGLKTEEGFYRSYDGVNQTQFTQPPNFSTNPGWIPWLRGEAEKRGFTLTEAAGDPAEVANELLQRITEKCEGCMREASCQECRDKTGR